VLEGPIAVTGATGFVGKYLVPALIQRGNPVRALARKAGRARAIERAGASIVVGNLLDPPSLERLVGGCAAVIHMAAVADSSNPQLNHDVNVIGSRNLVSACQAQGVPRIINISSTCAGRPLRDAYGQSKLEAEAEFTGKAGLVTTHLRPTMIYGHGSKEFDLFAAVAGKLPRVPIPGDGSALLRPVFLDDFIDLMLRVLDSEVEADRSFDIAGPETVPVNEFIELLARVQGSRARALPVPAAAAIAGARLLGRFQRHPFINVDQVMAFLQDTLVDIQPARNQLLWDPRPLEEGLAELFGDDS
jgi:nucleoside-diphosphate-sugar epimerase